MKILITGSTGLLGHALVSYLAPRCEVTGLSRHVPSAPHPDRHVVCDLLDAARLGEVIQALQPEVVLHTQALSDVDRCEREPNAAWAHNVETTAHVLDALEALNGSEPPLMVYISTDYVFSGTKRTPYAEEDAPDPISVYGRSKAEAERRALAYARSVVVRPSTLFGPGRMNFCDHVMERLAAGEPVEAFEDQVTSPTYTEDLAEVLEALAAAIWARRQSAWPRIVHAVNTGACSRVALAQRIAQLIGAPRELVRPIPMAAQQRPAARPAHAVLSVKHLPQLIGRTLRPWEDALAAYVRTRWPA